MLACAAIVVAAPTSAATDPVTIRALDPFTLQGTIASGQAGQIVTVQAKDCGVYPRIFRDVAEAHTSVGGAWGLHLSTGVTSTLRAVWNGKASKPITIWQRPIVHLERGNASNAWLVAVRAKSQFWRKRVRFERWDRFRTEWRVVRWVTLTETTAPPGATYASSSARFRAAVPPRSQVRAVLPRAQALPCYLPGVSKQVTAGA